MQTNNAFKFLLAFAGHAHIGPIERRVIFLPAGPCLTDCEQKYTRRTFQKHNFKFVGLKTENCML